MTETSTRDLLERLDELRAMCPDLRFGQMLATLGMLGEDAVGRNLWDIEDDELLAAIERFRQDLSQCEVGVDDPTYDLYQEAVPK